MCGIIGIASEKENIVPGIVRGLKRLEYRGYDSVGVAVIAPTGGLVVRKAAGRIESVVRRTGVQMLTSTTGIGHTRWATHGAPNDVNAHPHLDCTGSIAVVHNGVIRNFAAIRSYLKSRGHMIRSETDTELVAHLIEEGLEEGLDFIESLARALTTLKGSYALAILYKGHPDRVYFAKMHSPLLIGLGEGINAIASDATALLDITRKIIVLEDGDFGWISPRELAIYRLDPQGKPQPLPQPLVESRIKRVEWTPEAASKAGYPHYMIKEIYEQPQAVLETFNGSVEDPILSTVANILNEAESVLVTAAGTSYHAGLIFSYFASKLAGKIVHPVIASEHKQYTNSIGEKTVVLAISQSGETYDTLEAVRSWRRHGATIIGLTNVIGSALDREADVTLYTRAGPEIGVAATKTYLAQVTILELLSIILAEASGRLTRSEAGDLKRILASAPKVVKDAIQASDPYARQLTKERLGESMYILGRGLGSHVSKEAALKIKEIAYIHAESYPAGESKHGPIALVTPGFPVFIVATSDSPEVAGNAIEMKARGGRVVVVKPADLELELQSGISQLDMPPSGGKLLLETFALIPYFQLASYYIAVSRGYDPDKPRNLAKTVTVE